MGVMEAVYFGVPMIGIPVFGDQQSNVANCVEKGVAIGLDYRQVTERKLVESIRAIVTDSKYVLKFIPYRIAGNIKSTQCIVVFNPWWLWGGVYIDV